MRQTRRQQVTVAAGASVLGASVLALAACGPGAGTDAATGAAGSKTAAPAKIALGHQSQTTYDQLIRDALPAFKGAFPHIDVAYEPVTGAFNEKFTASWVAGSGPDVFQAWDYWFWQFAAKGVLANINDFARDLKQADIEDFAPWQWEGMQIPNTTFRFGLPKYVNVGVVYVNKTLLGQAGQAMPAPTWTRDEYVALLRKTTRPGGDRPVYGGRLNYAAFLRYQPHLWAYGGALVDSRDNARATYQLPAAMQGWEWLWNRMHQDHTWVQESQEKGEGWAGGPDGLAQGRIATSEDGMSALQTITEKMTAGWDILPAPRGPHSRASWGTTDGWGIWKATSRRDAAWDLTKFLAGSEFQRLQSRATLLLPARTSLFKDWAQVLLERYPVLQGVNLKAALDAISSRDSVRVVQQFPCYQEMITVLQPELDAVFRRGEKTPASLRDSVEQVERAGTSCGARFE